jgi:predicted histone-like DNA-binding protein
MGVQYVLVERGNPQNQQAPKKFYAQAVSRGEINLKTIKADISARSTVNPADVMAVIDTFVQILVQELGQGKIVRFGDFGSFQLSVSSEGADSPEKFHAGMITGAKIIFRPGIDLRDMIATLKYEKG